MRPQDDDRNAGRCHCPQCPTYDDCMSERRQRLFCSRGRTDCDPTSAGCVCGECPVWMEYGLGGYYFCTDGAASV